MAPRGEEPARRVDPDLGQQLVEGDDLAGPLGHRDLAAVAYETDPGDEQDPDVLRSEAHGFGGVAQSGDRAVMIGPPEVDQLVEPAAELVDEIAHVGAEVGR